MQYFVVDAFSERTFKGNPAGVCILDQPLPDEVMQQIAFENNLSETAFLHKSSDAYTLRWFTPKVEVGLCGHATLATSFVVMNYMDPSSRVVHFHTQSGVLTVSKEDDLYVLDFPSRNCVPCPMPDSLERALGTKVCQTHVARSLVAVLENEAAVKSISPDFQKLSELEDVRAVIVTAKGDDCDFVSRFFAPNIGINEDPVTGSAHCTLIPFWSERLNKKSLYAKQLSQRGGELYCEDCGERVKIGGKAALYLKGEILIDL